MTSILFVDDEQEVLEGITRSLRKEPYELLTATSGEQALSIMGTKGVDVVVADEMMPGMTGSELLAECRKQWPAVIRIMLTGATSVESAMNAIYDGWVYQYLHKPVKPADLAAVLHNALVARSVRIEDDSPHLVMSSDELDGLLSRIGFKSDIEHSEMIDQPQTSMLEWANELVRSDNVSARYEHIKTAVEVVEQILKIVDEKDGEPDSMMAVQKIREVFRKFRLSC